MAEKLLAYCWPGNVRELRNVIERAVALTRFDQITLADLPEKIREYRPPQVILGSADPGELAPLEEVERRYILHVLESAGENRTLAARTLGLDRKTLYRKLRQYGALGAGGSKGKRYPSTANNCVSRVSIHSRTQPWPLW